MKNVEVIEYDKCEDEYSEELAVMIYKGRIAVDDLNEYEILGLLSEVMPLKTNVAVVTKKNKDLFKYEGCDCERDRYFIKGSCECVITPDFYKYTIIIDNTDEYKEGNAFILTEAIFIDWIRIYAKEVIRKEKEWFPDFIRALNKKEEEDRRNG